MIDVLEFGFALDIETVHALLERIFDFRARLSHARKSALGRIASRLNDAKQFAAGDNIESGTNLGQSAQDRAIGIGFDGVTNQVIERAERSIEPAVMIEDGSLTIYIERRPQRFRRGAQVHFLAVKSAIAVVE